MIGILIEQVVFNDTFGGAELSAVQVDEESSYKAEDTSFLGFYGEVRPPLSWVLLQGNLEEQ